MTMRRLAATSILALGVAGAASADDLHLYNWGDYISPEILAAFTEETGIEISLDTYSSNEEMLARIQPGATGYDIIFPSIHMVDVMLHLEWLARTDINQAEAWGNIDPAFLRAANDPDGAYCMPYGWGTVGIFYNREMVSGDITSWADFFAIPEQTGNSITLLDDMREVLAIGQMVNGLSVNTQDTAEIQQAADWLIERTPGISAYTYAFPGLFLSGDVAAGQFFVGLAGAITEDDNLQYVIPEEGATMYEEAMCVLHDAPNPEGARAFMEFLLRPDVSVMNTTQQFNGSVNIPARDLLPDSILNNPAVNVPADVLERLQLFADVGTALRFYNRAWNTIRTAQ